MVVLVGDRSVAGASGAWRKRAIRGGLAGVVGGLVALEIACLHFGFRGPVVNLGYDLLGAPKRGPVLWAALALALVGVDRRIALRWVGAALLLDLGFFLGRLPGGGRHTFGNGPFLVLLAVGAWAGWILAGEARRQALKGVVLGAVMVGASKVSDAVIHLTALVEHQVLDQYVQTADRALGSPAWLMGRAVEASGTPGHLLLQTVYGQLSVAVMVVAVFQLRRGWTSHHMVRTFLLIGFIGPFCYLLFPVVGPAYAFGHLAPAFATTDVWPHLSNLGLHPAAMRFDAVTPRNCMPSLHTAWVVAIFIHTRRSSRWLRTAGTFWMVVTLAATLGFGYHYGVDLIAGLVLALTAEAALRDPERGWGWFRLRLVVVGSVTMLALFAAYRFLAVPMAEYPWLFAPLLLLVPVLASVAFWATFFALPGSPAAAWGEGGPLRAEARGRGVATAA
jgi:hypothetical protein